MTRALYSTLAAQFTLALACLLLSPACRGQGVTQPKFNTASEGVRPADVEAAVATLCSASDITHAKDGSISGCKTCPNGTDYQGTTNNSWSLYATSPGHFTSAKDDDLLIDGMGCDSHAMSWGGTYVFSLKEGKPSLLQYDKGLDTSQCFKAANPDGRDFLVCRTGSTFQGQTSETIFVANFDSKGNSDTANLLTVTNAEGACDASTTEYAENPDIRDVKFTYNDSKALTGLTITAAAKVVKCPSVKNGKASGKPSSSVKVFELGFVFDGRTFNVAPGSMPAFTLLNSSS